MAAFATDRRTPAIRLLIIFLALIMAFSAVSMPVYALSETVALFGLAAVLSSATAALGFKLVNNAEGKATIDKMCADFIKSALAPALVVIGTRVNGLQNDMAYIKMAVANAKTYLDERVLAWVQQWLGQNGVYNTLSLTGQQVLSQNIKSIPLDDALDQMANLGFVGKNFSYSADIMSDLVNYAKSVYGDNFYNADFYQFYASEYYTGEFVTYGFALMQIKDNMVVKVKISDINGIKYVQSDTDFCFAYNGSIVYARQNYNGNIEYMTSGYSGTPSVYNIYYSNAAKTGIVGTSVDLSTMGVLQNTSGLSGSDTIGEDYKDKTLDQILQGLKDKAPDWYDAGADSSTNAATGAKDLPVTVPAGAATQNPALNPDAVYYPPFDIPLDDTRSGATSSTTVGEGVSNAETAEKNEAASATVAETQTIIDSLINWANDYISPDKGLFSKFPLCIPYDAYLLVSSALGVDARDISDIVDQTDLGDLSDDAVVAQDDFVPVVDIKHDLTLDGNTYPIDISFDLRPYEQLIKLNRIFLSISLVAELIGSEYKRLRGGK